MSKSLDIIISVERSSFPVVRTVLIVALWPEMSCLLRNSAVL